MSRPDRPARERLGPWGVPAGFFAEGDLPAADAEDLRRLALDAAGLAGDEDPVEAARRRAMAAARFYPRPKS